MMIPIDRNGKRIDVWIAIFLSWLFLFVGSMLYFAKDENEEYYQNCTIESAIYLSDGTKINMPWWSYTLDQNTQIRVNVEVLEPLSEGDWFVDVLGREIEAEEAGQLIVNDVPTNIKEGAYATWHRVHVPAPVEAGRKEFTIRYKPETEAGRFCIWGSFVSTRPDSASHLHPTILSKGQLMTPTVKPIQNRGWSLKNLKKWDRLDWEHASEINEKQFFWRYGVRKSAFGRRDVGLGCVAIGITGFVAIFLVAFCRFSRNQPYLAITIVIIAAANFLIQYDILNRIVSALTFEYHGQTIVNGDWFDAIHYFTKAFQIFSNQTRDIFDWVPGMSAMAAFTFILAGIDMYPCKIVFILLHTGIGCLLYFAAYRISGWKWLSLIPMILWAIFNRPIKYNYLFWTEAPAMFFLTLWVTILVSRDRLNNSWFSLLTLAAVFGLSAYFRDIIIVTLPLCLGGILLCYGVSIKEKVLMALMASTVIALVWVPTPVYFQNKGNKCELANLLPMGAGRFQNAEMRVVGGKEKTASLTGLIFNAFKHYLKAAFKAPVAFSNKILESAQKFWMSDWNPTRRIDRIANRHWLIPSTDVLYVLTWLVGFAGFPLAFHRNREYWIVFCFLIYITFFHVLLFPTFTARHKAIYFPIVILFGFLGFQILVTFFHKKILSLVPTAFGQLSHSERVHGHHNTKI